MDPYTPIRDGHDRIDRKEIPMPGRQPFERDCKIHDENGAVKHDAILSGNSYVSILSPETTAYDSEGRPNLVRARVGRLLIRRPVQCYHGITICEQCAASWEWDYRVYYERTAGGRRLAMRMSALGESRKQHGDNTTGGETMPD
jgi:hypothetical protein